MYWIIVQDIQRFCIKNLHVKQFKNSNIGPTNINRVLTEIT